MRHSVGSPPHFPLPQPPFFDQAGDTIPADEMSCNRLLLLTQPRGTHKQEKKHQRQRKHEFFDNYRIEPTSSCTRAPIGLAGESLTARYPCARGDILAAQRRGISREDPEAAPLFPLKRTRPLSYDISYSPKHADGRALRSNQRVRRRRRSTLISFTPSARHANLSLRRTRVCERTLSHSVAPRVCVPMRSQYAGRVAGLFVCDLETSHCSN